MKYASLQSYDSLEQLPGGTKWEAPHGWENFFRENLWNDLTGKPSSDSAGALLHYIRSEYQHHEVFPTPSQLFRAFRETPLSSVRVVILGQDPYHEPDQADGMCFSVPDGFPIPPSLCNIYKELQSDLEHPSKNSSGDLSSWAKQGVLLLNTVLTVRRGSAASHRNQGWEAFTSAAIRTVDAMETPVVFVLWGRDARSKKSILSHPSHLIIESEHPSPLSAWRGFFGSHPFSAINAYLTKNHYPPIQW